MSLTNEDFQLTPGQALYHKWATSFALRMPANWSDLPERSQKEWERIAEEVSLIYIQQNDYYA